MVNFEMSHFLFHESSRRYVLAAGSLPEKPTATYTGKILPVLQYAG
jgi:hypothetical protein